MSTHDTSSRGMEEVGGSGNSDSARHRQNPVDTYPEDHTDSNPKAYPVNRSQPPLYKTSFDHQSRTSSSNNSHHTTSDPLRASLPDEEVSDILNKWLAKRMLDGKVRSAINTWEESQAVSGAKGTDGSTHGEKGRGSDRAARSPEEARKVRNAERRVKAGLRAVAVSALKSSEVPLMDEESIYSRLDAASVDFDASIPLAGRKLGRPMKQPGEKSSPRYQFPPDLDTEYVENIYGKLKESGLGNSYKQLGKFKAIVTNSTAQALRQHPEYDFDQVVNAVGKRIADRRGVSWTEDCSVLISQAAEIG